MKFKLNVPNLITLARLLLIIPFAYYFLRSEIQKSLIFFAVITLSDKLDGISARLMRQMTKFGSFFDSLTDWIFISTSVILLYSKYKTGKYATAYAVAILFPILLIGLLKLYNLKKRKIILKPAISTANVGLGYATILTLLIDFAYKNIFLATVLVFTYINMFVFAFKTLRQPSDS